MELALSHEGDDIKLFIRDIKWDELVAGFNRDETVSVDCFEIMVDNNFILEERSLDDYFLTLTLPKIIGPLTKIKEQIISRNPLEKMENIDEAKLKEEFPLLAKEGLSGHEIWEKYVAERLLHEEPIEVKLANENISIESFDIQMKVNSFCVTFRKKEKLLDFLQKANLTIPRKAWEELEVAAKEGKSYATEGLRAAFEEAGIIYRMMNLQTLKIKVWSNSPEEKLSKEFALSQENTSLKLFVQGISWKDFLPVFGDEIVDVFELNVIGPAKFPSNDEYFKVEDNVEMEDDSWLIFRRRKLSFKELVNRVSSLKAIGNANEPFLADIGNGNFEMKFTFAGSCCVLIFWQKDRLLHILERTGEIIPQPIVTELKNALNEGRSYCTNGLSEEFERASNRDRIERMVTLIKNYWIPGEEEEFKKALAVITNDISSQFGHEPSPNGNGKGGHRYGPPLLVYLRLEREGIDCFDGDGNIYGFNGEVVIRNIISVYEKWGKKLPDKVEFLNGILDKYIDRFGKAIVGPAPY